MFPSFQKSHRPILRYHPIIGHLFTPNLVARLGHPRPGYLIRTNAQGFRSDWDFQEKRNGPPRVLVFGDSNTAGDGVGNPMRFSDILGRKTACETYNFGLSGSGTDQQLLIWENLARGYDADLVVLCPFESNIMRNIVSYRPAINRITGQVVKMPKPYFEWDNCTLTLRNQPVPKERDEIPSTGAPVTSRPFRKLKKMILDRIPQSRRVAVRIADRRNAYSNSLSRPWLLMRAIMERFVNNSRVPVLVMPLPAETFFVNGKTPSYLKRYREWEAESGKFALVDVLSTIRQIPPAHRRRLHFSDDPHYNEFGHAAIAEALTPKVKRYLKLS